MEINKNHGTLGSPYNLSQGEGSLVKMEQMLVTASKRVANLEIKMYKIKLQLLIQLFL